MSDLAKEDWSGAEVQGQDQGANGNRLMFCAPLDPTFQQANQAGGAVRCCAKWPKASQNLRKAMDLRRFEALPRLRALLWEHDALSADVLPAGQQELPSQLHTLQGY